MFSFPCNFCSLLDNNDDVGFFNPHYRQFFTASRLIYLRVIFRQNENAIFIAPALN